MRCWLQYFFQTNLLLEKFFLDYKLFCKFVLFLLRNLMPPHHDNEASAAFLRDNIGLENPFIEWVVVRPDGLINAEVSDYEVVATPPRTIFNGPTTPRANVAHFMCECIEKPNLWLLWKGKMPVVFNKK